MPDATRDVEILATGTHLGHPVTEHDLDTMVVNFGALGAYLKPPLKLGHGDKQIIAEQADGQPALGWLKAVRREGNKLVASVANIPATFAELIDKGRYRRVSSEFYPDWSLTPFERNLKTGVKGPTLKALSLLGADTPIVKNLQDLAAVLTSEGAGPVTCSETQPDADTVTGSAEAASASEDRDGRGKDAAPSSLSDDTIRRLADAIAQTIHAHGTMMPDRGPQRGRSMTDAEKQALIDETKTALLSEAKAAVQADLDKLRADVTTLSEAKTAQDAEVTRLAAQNTALQAAADAAQGRALHVEAVQFSETAMKAAKITAKQAPLAVELYKALETKTAIPKDAAKAVGLSEQDWSPRAMLQAFIDASPTGRLVGEIGTDTPAPQSFDVRLAEIAKDKGLDLAKPEHRQAALVILGTLGGDGIPDYTTPTGTRRQAA